MEIVPGLHCLAGVGLGVNAYLWRPWGAETGRRGDDAVLFDCGYPWQAAALVDSLERLGCPIEQLSAIAITHDDYDHSGALAELVAIAEGAGAVRESSPTGWRPRASRAGPGARSAAKRNVGSLITQRGDRARLCSAAQAAGDGDAAGRRRRCGAGRLDCGAHARPHAGPSRLLASGSSVLIAGDALGGPQGDGEIRAKRGITRSTTRKSCGASASWPRCGPTRSASGTAGRSSGAPPPARPARGSLPGPEAS